MLGSSPLFPLTHSSSPPVDSLQILATDAIHAEWSSCRRSSRKIDKLHKRSGGPPGRCLRSPGGTLTRLSLPRCKILNRDHNNTLIDFRNVATEMLFILHLTSCLLKVIYATLLASSLEMHNSRARARVPCCETRDSPGIGGWYVEELLRALAFAHYWLRDQKVFPPH